MKIDKQWCHLWAVRIVCNINFCIYFLLYVSVVHNYYYVKKEFKYFSVFSFVILSCLLCGCVLLRHTFAFTTVMYFDTFMIDSLWNIDILFAHFSKKLRFLLAIRKNTCFKLMWWLYTVRYNTMYYYVVVGCSSSDVTSGALLV